MSYVRQTQPKAQTEANAKILRALVKQPDNKVCADCKRNDPRWASWNIGCYLCIRCSGIHRSMGTHISKVKSIDLDIWTPEQMAAIQRWGNKRCNLYWEAHLKAGHIPPEHKVESFVRSKYEMRRWAKDGPVPEDPATLEGAASAPVAAAEEASNGASSSSTSSRRSASGRAAPASAVDLLGGDGDAAPPVGKATTSVTSPTSSVGATQTSSQINNKAAAPPKAASSGGGGGLFDLDWQEGPASSSSMASPTGSTAARGSNKNDILSLFAASSKPAAPASGPRTSGVGLDAFGGMSLGGAGQGQTHAPTDPWAFGGQTAAPAAASSTSNNIWGGSGAAASDPWASFSSPTSKATNSSTDAWGGATKSPTTSTLSNNAKNDAFADIWGDFK